MSGQHNRSGCSAGVDGAIQDVACSNTQSDLTDERLLRAYVTSQDASAFAAIVRRHGGLVSGVCRRVLGCEQDVEDAFQATFLVLVRKAPSLSRPNLLGNWLYGVAYRIASKMRSASIRKRKREAPMFNLPAPDATDDASWDDLRRVLDDELRRLPERYRRPIVLFYFEGKSAEEVALALGRPRGTVLSQLARARELLRVRLSHHNPALLVGVLASLLARTASSEAAVSDRLIDLGVQTLPASGACVSAQARLLAQRILKDMLLRRLGVIGSLFSAVLLAPWLGFLSYRALHAPPAAATQAESRFDRDELKGDWQVFAVVQDGRVLPEDQFPVTRLKIRDDTILHEGGPHQPLEVRFRLHPEQQPKAMDMESQGYHADTYHAIYALEGDTLTICRPDGATRPKEFASSPGSNVLIYTAKRIRPAGP
jgi:RNA polymerase sigma factor (sigma-70 family)